MGFDAVDEGQSIVGGTFEPKKREMSPILGECACGSSYCIETAISLLRCDPATPVKERLLNYHQAIWFLQRECSHLRRQITQSELLNETEQEPGDEL